MDIKRKFMCVAVCVAMKSFIVRSQKSAGTRVGVSARMYNDSNSLGDGAKEGRGSKDRHAGTREGISTFIHVANSHADRAEDGHRSDCRHSANSWWV